MKQTHSLCPSTKSMGMREADTTETKCSTSNRGHGRSLQGTVTTAGGVGGLGPGDLPYMSPWLSQLPHPWVC